VEGNTSKFLSQIGLSGFDMGYLLIAVAVLLILFLVVLILLIVQINKIGKLRKRLNKFLLGKDGKSLEQGIVSLFEDTKFLKVSTEKNKKDIQTLYKNMESTYQKMGLVKYGNVFKECRARDLIAKYVGQTAANVKEALKEAEGGILFLDEAYALVDEGNGGYGKEAIDTLCAEIDNRGSDLVVIVAGYKDEMDKFLGVNEGMKRRFPIEINFEEYTTEELLEVFKFMIQKKGLLYNGKLEDFLLKFFLKKSKEKGFGNAGGVRNYADHVYENVMCRIGKEEYYSDEMLMITEADL